METFNKETLKKYSEQGRFCPYCGSINYDHVGLRNRTWSENTVYVRCDDCHKCWSEHHGIKEIVEIDPSQFKEIEYQNRERFESLHPPFGEPEPKPDECKDLADDGICDTFDYESENSFSEQQARDEFEPQDPFKSPKQTESE